MNLVFCARPDNDLFRVLCACGVECPRYDGVAEAVERAPAGAGVLLLADGYPQRPTLIAPAVFNAAAAKRQRLYVEFPAALPGLEGGAPRATQWERAVVASDRFAPALEKLRILAIHDCHYVPFDVAGADIVVARVAGLDRAVYGLPKQAFPVLFERAGVLVAATKLSQFVTARYAPAEAWRAIWQTVLGWLCPGEKIPELKWTPTVQPAYGAETQLPVDAELQAFRRGAEWFKRSRLLVHPAWKADVERYPDGIGPAPPAAAPVGDGKEGLLEGYSSTIGCDGTQPVRCFLRNDCTGESAMALAFDAAINRDAASREISANLNDFIYFHSQLAQGPRADPASPSFGLVGWDVPKNSGAYYGDDNARSLLGTIASAALLKSERWDEPLLRCLLANLRTTGSFGFRGNRLDEADLQKNGWRHYFNAPTINCAPHYEAHLWACYLWAYRQTRYEPFLERARTAIRMTMAAYPDQWKWANGLQQERARMLLPLAWLVRVQDTPPHREWLRRVAQDLLSFQAANGGLREELGGPGRGSYGPPRTNEDYGTAEATLLQQNGDPIVDLLYTTNFAFLALHEAAAATGDRYYADATDKLAEFLCRIQVRSEAHPELDGAWFRAFDFRRWEYWASNADLGWGAWSIETGWTQAWIVSVLALRHLKTSFWELTAGSQVQRRLASLLPVMFPAQ